MGAAKSKRFDVPAFGMSIVQGRAMKPATKHLFPVEGDGTRIVAMQPKAGRELIDAGVTQIMRPNDRLDRPGLAFHPATKHRFILNAEVPELHGLIPADERVNSLNIAGKTMDILLQAVVYTPGLDLTNHPSIFHFHAVTGQDASGETCEWARYGSF